MLKLQIILLRNAHGLIQQLQDTLHHHIQLQKQRLCLTYPKTFNSHLNHITHSSENSSELAKYAHIILDQNKNINNYLVVKTYLENQKKN